MMFIKLSIAVFLLRIAVKRPYVWILRISMGVVAIWSVAIFIYDLFQCVPVQAQWDFTIKSAKCVSGPSFVAAAYSISVMTIVTDWLYALLPIPMIWSVQMSVQAKATVAFVLSLGILYAASLALLTRQQTNEDCSASVATLIRLKYIVELANISDVLCSSPLPLSTSSLTFHSHRRWNYSHGLDARRAGRCNNGCVPRNNATSAPHTQLPGLRKRPRGPEHAAHAPQRHLRWPLEHDIQPWEM